MRYRVLFQANDVGGSLCTAGTFSSLSEAQAEADKLNWPDVLDRAWVEPEPEVFNFTPHPINILDSEGRELVTISPIGVVARLVAVTRRDTWIGDIPTSRTVFGEPEGLPKEDGDYYIVSQLVKSAFPERTDLLVPAEVVRDENGRIIGCRSLGR